MSDLTKGVDACTGCDCPAEICRELWAEQRKCCPDCSHGAKEERAEEPGRWLFEHIPWNQVDEPAAIWEDALPDERNAWANVERELSDRRPAEPARAAEPKPVEMTSVTENVDAALLALGGLRADLAKRTDSELVVVAAAWAAVNNAGIVDPFVDPTTWPEFTARLKAQYQCDLNFWKQENGELEEKLTKAEKRNDELDEELQQADDAAEEAGFPRGAETPAAIIRMLTRQWREADDRAKALDDELAETKEELTSEQRGFKVYREEAKRIDAAHNESAEQLFADHEVTKLKLFEANKENARLTKEREGEREKTSAVLIRLLVQLGNADAVRAIGPGAGTTPEQILRDAIDEAVNALQPPPTASAAKDDVCPRCGGLGRVRPGSTTEAACGICSGTGKKPTSPVEEPSPPLTDDMLADTAEARGERIEISKGRLAARRAMAESSSSPVAQASGTQRSSPPVSAQPEPKDPPGVRIRDDIRTVRAEATPPRVVDAPGTGGDELLRARACLDEWQNAPAGSYDESKALVESIEFIIKHLENRRA